MTHFVLMEGWQNEGESFQALYTTLDYVITAVESQLKGHTSSKYWTILKVEADHPELTEAIGFMEEANWKCGCGATLTAGVSGDEQFDFYCLHRDELKHNIMFLGYTGKLLM